ncbi:pyridoxal phosphate-dependent aminotransferase [Marinigracilibium pacificum]|uniref:Aminotransferase n=1 Tax=Marinigracilibium pacificum TaxID=2729599 RepID=A0A848J6C9_9BACT|nr:aminotransferase class I/II-fold pyridoxal phosphate-dependent enzyme [Marinigracilibium pacificum]NMM50024.1 aminotransferase class I/II-fold pyridoxal phosphate-dependent enzyme [Marinigracilibium pacificum]
MQIKLASRLGNQKEYYFSTKLKQLNEMKENGIKIINLGIGSPDLPPPESAVLSLIRESGRIDTHGYQSYRGLPEFRKAIANFYNENYLTDINSDNVLPLIGSKEGLMHIAMTYLEEGDVALIPNPGYPTYEAVTRMAGAIPVSYDLNEEENWIINTSYLEYLINNHSVKVLFLNYPHMPTGAMANIELFKSILKIATKYNVLVVNDNPYSFILNDNPVSALQVEGIHPNLIELNSLSKSHNMAGWRIGYMISSEDHINNVLRFKTNMDSGMFLPLQMAAVSALQAGVSWFKDLNNEYFKRKELALEILDLLNCTYSKSSAGMFIWAKIPDYFKSGEELSDYLLDATGIFITPGSVFGSRGNGFIRISLCSNLNVLSEAINKILSIPNKKVV